MKEHVAAYMARRTAMCTDEEWIVDGNEWMTGYLGVRGIE